MKIIRYILFLPVSIAAFLILSYIVTWILYYVWKVLFFIMAFGTRFDSEPILGFEYDIEKFKSFLITECLGILISAVVSGFIGGAILPNKYKAFFATFASFAFAILMIICGVRLWNSEHWFYSAITEIVLIIAALLYCGGLFAGESE